MITFLIYHLSRNQTCLGLQVSVRLLDLQTGSAVLLEATCSQTITAFQGEHGWLQMIS